MRKNTDEWHASSKCQRKEQELEKELEAEKQRSAEAKLVSPSHVRAVAAVLNVDLRASGLLAGVHGTRVDGHGEPGGFAGGCWVGFVLWEEGAV